MATASRDAAGFFGGRHFANAPFAVIQDESRRYYGLMFSTPKWCIRPTARNCSRNFVRKVAGLTGDWTMRASARRPSKIRAQVGTAGDLRPPGGVDSAVAADSDP